MNKYKWHTFLICFAILLIVGILSYFAYLSFFQGSDPITFRNIPFSTDKAIYYPGDKISIFVSFDKHTDAAATAYFTLVNGEHYNNAPQTIRACGKGCIGDYWFYEVVEVPKYAKPGIYHVEGYVEYAVNPLRTIGVNFRSQPVEVQDISEKQEQLNICN